MIIIIIAIIKFIQIKVIIKLHKSIFIYSSYAYNFFQLIINS